jgi:hypothetical protein
LYFSDESPIRSEGDAVTVKHDNLIAIGIIAFDDRITYQILCRLLLPYSSLMACLFQLAVTRGVDLSLAARGAEYFERNAQ